VSAAPDLPSWAAPQRVIFDCDGVLVDSERLCNQAMADLLADLGLRFSLEQTVQQFIGRSLSQCLAIIEQHLGCAPPQDLRSRLAQRTRVALELGLTAMPGIEVVLDTLAWPSCVASNGNRAKMDFTLGHTGLLPRFAGRMFCADDVAQPKPAPDLFLHAARCCGAEPGRCVVVEDTPTGIRAARAAGMRALAFAGLTPLYRLLEAGADACFQSMSELPGLLQPTAGRG
jgi:HAD superfamily hydrolase (TIGR01509 family)